MELLVLLSLCLLTFIGKTFGDDSIKITIKEDEDIILNCSFGTDITGHRIEWKKDDKDVFYFDFRKEDPTVEDPKFKDRVSRFSEDLKSGDASVKIKGAKVSDSGNYTCLHINEPGKDPVHQRLIELTVDCILKDRTKDPERKQGTCLPPGIRAFGKKNGRRQVECKAVGAFPQPKMELRNDADVTFEPEKYNVSQNGTYFDVTLIAVVTEEGFYHCVATQEKICHQIKSEETEVLMPIDADKWKPSAIGFAIGFAVVSVLAIVLAAVLISKRENFTCTYRNCGPNQDDCHVEKSASNQVSAY